MAESLNQKLKCLMEIIKLVAADASNISVLSCDTNMKTQSLGYLMAK